MSIATEIPQPPGAAGRGRISYKAACELLGVGRSTLFELLSRGELRRVYVPGVSRPGVFRAEVEALLARGAETPAEPSS